MTNWQKVLLFTIIILYAIVNESTRIDQNRKIRELDLYNKNYAEWLILIDAEYNKFSKEHTHFYPHGKPRP